jgi:hypothetical protein
MEPTTQRSGWCLGLTILAGFFHLQDILCTLAFVGHELSHQGEICKDGHNSPMALSPSDLMVLMAIVLAPTLPSIYVLAKKTTIGWTIVGLVLAVVAWVVTGTAVTIGALSTACWGSL